MAKPAPVPVYSVVATQEGHALHRNGAIFKTPAGMDMVMPTKALADAVAEEWRAQGEKIKPASMPMTQLAATALDMIRKNRKAEIDRVASYAHADLLCFRADDPDELIARQHKIWQPVLDWCAGRFDASLRTGQGIMPIAQPPEALRALRIAVESYDDFALTGLKHAAEVSGSLVLALALAERHMTVEQAFDAAELDAQFQMEKWGDDPASAKRHESILDDLVACEKWFGLLTISRS